LANELIGPESPVTEEEETKEADLGYINYYQPDEEEGEGEIEDSEQVLVIQNVYDEFSLIPTA